MPLAMALSSAILVRNFPMPIYRGFQVMSFDIIQLHFDERKWKGDEGLREVRFGAFLCLRLIFDQSNSNI